MLLFSTINSSSLIIRLCKPKHSTCQNRFKTFPLNLSDFISPASTLHLTSFFFTISIFTNHQLGLVLSFKHVSLLFPLTPGIGVSTTFLFGSNFPTRLILLTFQNSSHAPINVSRPCHFNFLIFLWNRNFTGTSFWTSPRYQISQHPKQSPLSVYPLELPLPFFSDLILTYSPYYTCVFS